MAADPPETAPEAPTTEAPAAEPEAAPAAPAAATPTWRTRGQARRRLRFLTSARELGLRDLGGLVFDLHRFERERPDLVTAKLDALAAVDTERRALQAALGDEHEVDVLREPGVASCTGCGSLLPSDARFCPSCGQAVSAS